MNNIINAILIATLIFALFKNYKNGVMLYSVCVIIAPVFHFSDLNISFDIIAFIVLAIFFLFKNGFKVQISREIIGLYLYLIIYIVSSVFALIIYNTPISFISIYGIIRFVFTLQIFLIVFDDKITLYLDRMCSIILPIESVCCLLQIANLVPVRLFYDLYFKESQVPLATALNWGYFSRAFGTTPSPLILVAIALMMFSFYFSSFLSENSPYRFQIVKIAMCLFIAITTLTKTAILGIPLIFFAVLFTSPIRNSKYFRRILILIPLFVVGIGIVSWLIEQGTTIRYYLSFLTDPFSSFETRYSSSDGNLSETIKMIFKGNFIIGNANTRFQNVFIGDSTYVVLLYETGILGLLSYAFPYIKSFITSARTKDNIRIVMLFAFLLAGLGSTVHTSQYLMVFISFILMNNKRMRPADEG